MDAFTAGYEFFASHASDFAGINMGIDYVNSVNSEIDAFLNNLSHFKDFNTSAE